MSEFTALKDLPTAMQEPGPAHEIPSSVLYSAGLGLGMTAQFVPSQCSIRGLCRTPETTVPTA